MTVRHWMQRANRCDRRVWRALAGRRGDARTVNGSDKSCDRWPNWVVYFGPAVFGGAGTMAGASLSKYLRTRCAAGADSWPDPKTHLVMTRAAALLAITSSLVLQTAARDVNVSCGFTHRLDSDHVSYYFLVSDSEVPSAPPRLYLVSWRRSLLHRCIWSDHAAWVQNYAALCRESTHSFSEGLDDNMNITSVIGSEGVCQRAGNMEARRLRSLSTTLPKVVGDRSEVRGSARVKRGFIVPGTLWCGSGNKALSQENLGELVSNELTHVIGLVGDCSLDFIRCNIIKPEGYFWLSSSGTFSCCMILK